MSIKEKIRKIAAQAPFLPKLGQGVLFLLKYYFAIVALSVVYKVIFLIFNHPGENCSFGDYVDIIRYGLKHDFAVAGYFSIIPLFLNIVIIFKEIPLGIFYKCYNSILSFAIALAFISDFTLYPYWGHKLDASAIIVYIDSPANAAASVTTMHLILLGIALAALTFITYKAFSFVCRKRHRKKRDESRSIFGRIIQSIAYILIGGIMFLGIRGGVTESTNNIGTVYYTNRMVLNHAAINPVFSFMHTLANIEDFSDEYDFFNEEERMSIFDGLYRQDTQITDTLLTNAHPNVITIILEGMGACFVEELGGKKGITPNISRLCNEGVLFTDCHANSYRTDRGLICTLSGYPSFPKTSVMKATNKSQKLPSLAASLKEAGYTSTFLYGGDVNFTNMNGYFYSTGYDKVLSNKDFSSKEASTHKWGVSDDITFDRLFRMTQSMEEEPWHITFLTLSSHEPWEVPYNRIKNDEKANAFAFTDEMLGKFIDRLKTTDVWDNTLIICIADHTVMGYPQGARQTDRNRNHILLLLLGGAIKRPLRINSICNQSDMVATILAQMQLPIDEFRFSRNILSPEYSYPFAYSSFNNGITFIDSTGHSTLDLDSGIELVNSPEEGGEKRIRRAKATLQSTYTDFMNL